MGDTTQQVIVALEELLLQPQVRASRARLDALLCEDFQEIGASGRMFGKDDVLGRLPSEEGVVFEAGDFALREIAPDVALLTYRATRRADGRDAHSLRSSLWRREAGRWRMAFHQGTPLPVGASADVLDIATGKGAA